MNPCSAKSVKRFIRLFLSINQPAWCFHQTLTLHKQFEIASLYVEERQQDGSIHYHILFFIFDRNQFPLSSEKAKNWLQREVFKRWNRINGNTLTAVANKLTLHEKDLSSLTYLTKGISIVRTRARTVNWWGCRNKTLIRANSVQVSKAEVSHVFGTLFPKSCFQHQQALVEPPNCRHVFTKQNLEFMRAYGEIVQGTDWHDYKRVRMGLKRRVSDDEFLRFLN
jgi:hypothetical protein